MIDVKHQNQDALNEVQEEQYTRLTVGYDAENANKELKIIRAYCKQNRAEVIEIKHSGLFCAAVCAVPKELVGDFKIGLQGHLEQLRARGA